MARQVPSTPHKMNTHSGQHRDDELLTEFKTFNDKLEQLVQESPGKFVVIKHTKILAVKDDYSAALEFGYSKLGSSEPFFVEQVRDPRGSERRDKVFHTKLEYFR
jgi:hypothetical protein